MHGRDTDRQGLTPTVLVAAGMLLSRLSGYARVVLFSHIFGVETVAADAFNQALKIPNFLQNLFGEGVLSASLIPVYSGLLARQQQDEADRSARVVLGLIVFLTSVIVLAGVLWTGPLIAIIAPGFQGERRELTIHLVRIMFPGVALLVFSAWCLAVLNSHHKFFLAYAAPVSWNAAMVATLVFGRGTELPRLAVDVAWAAVVGGGFQFGVQVPTVWRIMAPHWSRRRHEFNHHVRRVLTTSLPVIFSRGVIQVSAYVDSLIASYLPTGAPTALAYATQLYQLPVSLFGMAVSSAALPGLSAAAGRQATDVLGERLLGGQRTIAALVIPSMVAFLALGDVIVALLLQGGRFSHGDTQYVWGVLAGSAVGLLATTIGRLYASAFYALGDTKTPMRFALVRIALVTGLGYLLAIPFPGWVHIAQRWGAAGLTVSAGLAGWVEFALLRRALARRLGAITIAPSFLVRTWAVALTAAVPATLFRWVIPVDRFVVRGFVLLGLYGVVFLLIADRVGILGLRDTLRRFLPRGR